MKARKRAVVQQSRPSVGVAIPYSFPGWQPSASRADPFLRNPDPPTALDHIGVRDPGVAIPYVRPGIRVVVEPLVELGKRVTLLDVVAELLVRKLQPHARTELVGVADR